MTIHLPPVLERFVQNEVLRGRFASDQEAIAEAVRLLRQHHQVAGIQPKPLNEDDWERLLVQAGLLSSVPSAPAVPALRRAFQPIAIAGEPLSETVIRERR